MTTTPTTEEARQLSDALLAFFDGLDRVSQRYHLVQPGIALVKAHAPALAIARRYRTPKEIPVLDVHHIGATGDACPRCGCIIPLGEPQCCLAKVCGQRSPEPMTVDGKPSYVCCSNTDCDGIYHEAMLKSGALSFTWETWPERVPWYINCGKKGPACDDTEEYQCRGCGKSEYTRHNPPPSCPGCGLTSAPDQEPSGVEELVHEP